MHISDSLMFVNSNPLTPSVSVLLSNVGGMDVYEIRKHNLLVLEAEAASLKAIGDAMVAALQRRAPSERAPDYPNVLSQHKGKKPMGQKIARLIEEAMGKPKGWMDALQSAEVEAAIEAKEAAQIAMNIEPGPLRDGWLQHGRLLAEKNPKKTAGSPFGDIPRGGAPPRSKRRRGTQ